MQIGKIPFIAHRLLKAAFIFTFVGASGGCTAEVSVVDRPEVQVPDASDSPRVAATVQALGSKPHTSCTSATHDGHGYWFCPVNASWTAAKTACETTGVDTKLVSVDNAAENLFLQSNIGLDVRIGASDQTVEGTWRWDNGNIQFWSGTSAGSAVGGNYANWDLPFGQPDNGGLGTHDCAVMSAWSGLWFDVSCTTGYWYVCEEDLCPSDAAKEAPGVCGCGTPDTDTDGDGTPNCNDECSADATRTALPCAPESGCTYATYEGSDYFFCSAVRTHADARSKCEGVSMQLARIDTAAENAWIDTQIATDRWVAGSDVGVEGDWVWEPTGYPFWQGTSVGSAVGIAYTNWSAGQPNNFAGAQDCLTIFGAGGQWDDEGCTELEQYICEKSDERLREDEIVDEDCDGIEDSVEVGAGLDPADPDDANADGDSDGLSDSEELQLGGDPTDADTDGDSENDDPDLLRPLDLDGDGFTTLKDNCPTVVNASQLDDDSDGTGDLCDLTPTGATEETTLERVRTLRHQTAGTFALLASGQLDPKRSGGDLHGYLETGTSFLLFGEAGSGLTQVTELVHADGRHAYAVSGGEITTWEGRSFTVRGTLGYVASSTPSFGTSASVRRFELGSGGATKQAVTANSTEATALLGAGYSEITALGYGLRDDGRVRNPRSVARYRSSVNGATLHTSRPSAEPLVVGLDTEGKQFQVLAEQNGWTVPLYRLRNGSGFEVLSSSATEVGTLTGSGYALEGVIGWIFRDTSAMDTLHHVARLVRLKKSGRYEHSADPDEIAALQGDGYTEATVLGRVVRVPAKDLDPQACVARLNPLDRLDETLGVTPDPGVREIASLRMFVSAYTIYRVLSGQVVSETEQAIDDLLDGVDAETRARLLAEALEVLSISSIDRAAALGMLASLDPIGGSGPVDYTAISYGVSRQALSAGDTVFNNGIDPASGASLMRVRAPQCEGVTYGGTDPASSNKADRAVTEGKWQFSPGCDFENCALSAGELQPVIFGVQDGDHVVDTSNDAETWADDHPEVGYSIKGTVVSPSCGGCPAALGQRCELGQCVQYPVVKANQIVTFTGMNFWDGTSAQLFFTNQTDSSTTAVRAIVDVDIVPLGGPTAPDNALRCDADPIDYNNVPGVGDPETRVERLISRGALPASIEAGHFYTVQAINANGTYFHWGESVPIDPLQREEDGRTIHLCRPPNCTPSPDPSLAECELLPSMPQCGSGSVGGTWTSPPRSIEKCKSDFGEFYSATDCPETPPSMISEPELGGLPVLIYVTDPEPKVVVQTQLAGTWCRDETGGDALGADELMVWVGGYTDIPAWDDLQDLEDDFGFYMDEDSDVHEKKVRRKLMSSVDLALGSSTQINVVRVGEDDDFDWDHAIVGIVTGIAGAYGGAAAGAELGPVGAVGGGVAGGVGGFFAGVAAALAVFPGPDDQIGQAAWIFRAGDVSARALLARDGVISPGAAPVLGDDPQPFESPMGQLDKYLDGRSSTKHPGVDLVSYRLNQDIMTCATSAACTSGWTCVHGACVKPDWTDGTIPHGTFDPLTDVPGVVEIIHLDGAGEYLLYLSTSLSDE